MIIVTSHKETVDITESGFAPQEDYIQMRTVVQKFGRRYGHFVPEIAI